MKAINIKQFSVDDLLALRDRINAALESRVDRERRDLESRLKRLQRFKSSADQAREVGATTKSKPTKKAKQKATKKVAAKFRNPDNTSETWSGRGLKPRWMASAIKAGKSLEEFRIATD